MKSDSTKRIRRAMRAGIRGIVQSPKAYGFIGPGGVAMPKPIFDRTGLERFDVSVWTIWDQYDPQTSAPKIVRDGLTEDEAMHLAYGIAPPRLRGFIDPLVLLALLLLGPVFAVGLAFGVGVGVAAERAAEPREIAACRAELEVYAESACICWMAETVEVNS